MILDRVEDIFMIFAVDVAYHEDSACVAGVLFETWESSSFEKVYTKRVDSIAGYESGAFYKRELPCILSLLDEVSEPIDFIILDGYVFLGEDRSAGLGVHLWNEINRRTPIIGVAKNYYKDTPAECEILRGKSQKPLYITSIGVDLEDAKKYILKMHGLNRMPTLLKKVDQISKSVE
ncbi:endonuclease V [Acinetobacter junii]|uniref:endonuclease V n=1 Tax=Acinetobacter junii TaxID=40215 RepID=UPI00384E6F19